jgi:hypothetical protein
MSRTYLEDDSSKDLEGSVEFLANDGTSPFDLLTHKVKHSCTAFDDAKARKSIRLQNCMRYQQRWGRLAHGTSNSPKAARTPPR